MERIQEIMKKTDVLGAELNVYNYSSEDCCVIPSTDFTGNCFKCGKQVFVKGRIKIKNHGRTRERRTKDIEMDFDSFRYNTNNTKPVGYRSAY